MARRNKDFLVIMLMVPRMGFLPNQFGLVVEDEILIIVLANGLWVNLHQLYARQVLESHLKEPSFMEIYLSKDLQLVISLELVSKSAEGAILYFTDFFKVFVFRVSRKDQTQAKFEHENQEYFAMVYLLLNFVIDLAFGIGLEYYQNHLHQNLFNSYL